MLRILKRGIGVHHGGLLPILKEIIEILFQVTPLLLLLTSNAQCDPVVPVATDQACHAIDHDCCQHL
jgi:hypothetical protein